MNVRSEIVVESKKNKNRLLVVSGVAVLIATLAIVLVAGASWHSWVISPPSAGQQAEEVAALEAQVLPVVKDLRATWYLNEGIKNDSIYWKRGKFTRDRERARQDGDSLFDDETEAAFEQFNNAIRSAGVPVNRLAEAKFAADGTLKYASFHRSGGGITFVFAYIYSPGAKPPEWTSKLGPVVLTRIGDSDWWFEQSPDD
jgi:uncharacterized membrane protein YqjE